MLRQFSTSSQRVQPFVALGGREAALVDRLAEVGEQHHAAGAVVGEELLEQGEPGEAEVLGFVDDDRVEAVGDLRPVADEVAGHHRVPPGAVGVVGHVEWRHAVDDAGDAVEVADGDVEVGEAGGGDVGERFVEAGEQHPFAAGCGTPGPREGEAGLAGAGATGDAHPPVEVERLERPGLVAADLAEAASGVSGSGLGVPDERGVGPQHVEHRLHALVADA